jgi:hypothetical protein
MMKNAETKTRSSLTILRESGITSGTLNSLELCMYEFAKAKKISTSEVWQQVANYWSQFRPNNASFVEQARIWFIAVMGFAAESELTELINKIYKK